MSSILFYGVPGSGKTTLLCTLAKHGYKVRLVDVDNKANRMVNIKPLIDAGKVVVTPIDRVLTESSMKERIMSATKPPSKMPQGYLSLCDFVNNIYDEEGDPDGCDVLGWDSLTSHVEHLKKLISFNQKKAHFTFDEWDILLQNLTEFVVEFITLQKYYKHVILTCHAQTETDNETGAVTQILPLIEGSYRYRIGKEFEEVWYFDPKGGKDGVDWRVVTQPQRKITARTSRDLDPIEACDWEDLFKQDFEEVKEKLKKKGAKK